MAYNEIRLFWQLMEAGVNGHLSLIVQNHVVAESRHVRENATALFPITEENTVTEIKTRLNPVTHRYAQVNGKKLNIFTQKNYTMFAIAQKNAIYYKGVCLSI